MTVNRGIHPARREGIIYWAKQCIFDASGNAGEREVAVYKVSGYRLPAR
jgi:hypothetical protein